MSATLQSPAALSPAGGGADALAAVKQLVLDAVSSPLTRAMYARALEDFFAWWEEHDRPAFAPQGGIGPVSLVSLGQIGDPVFHESPGSFFRGSLFGTCAPPPFSKKAVMPVAPGGETSTCSGPKCL